jgi:hypothetical protein
MKCYKDNYGSDVDGNRGITVWECELEKSDNDEIVEKIEDQLIDCEEGDYPEYVTITMINPMNDEEIDFDVCVKDYL